MAWTITNSVCDLQPGAVIGCALDQGDYPVQVYFYSEGRVIHQISGIRGEVRLGASHTQRATRFVEPLVSARAPVQHFDQVCLDVVIKPLSCTSPRAHLHAHRCCLRSVFQMAPRSRPILAGGSMHRECLPGFRASLRVCRCSDPKP